MVRKPVSPEEARGIVRLNVLRVGDESLEVRREGLVHMCDVEGTVINDIGVESLAGANVRVNLADFPEFPLQPGLDELHGLSPGSALGIVGLARSYLFIHAKLNWKTVASLSTILHRDVGAPGLILEARFATALVQKKGDLEPMDLYGAPEMRAALIRLGVSGPTLRAKGRVQGGKRLL